MNTTRRQFYTFPITPLFDSSNIYVREVFNVLVYFQSIPTSLVVALTPVH
jgi:hypothetical protein